MTRVALALLLTASFFCLSACKKQTNDKDAIRAGILQHLTSIGTLNMSAMDIDIRSVSVSGNQGHAEVEFRAKVTGSPGGGMQVAYDLEKRGNAWLVVKSQPLGGMQHPSANQSPNTNQPVHSMPNFNELLNPSGASEQATLPPGHSPVNPSQSPSPPLSSSQTQSTPKKP